MLGELGFAVCMRICTMQEQYLELTSSIPSSATLFGLGEYTSNVGFPLRRDGIPYTLWNRDQPPAVPNTNLYGSHPIILDVRDGEFMGHMLPCQDDVQQRRLVLICKTSVQQCAGATHRAQVQSSEWEYLPNAWPERSLIGAGGLCHGVMILNSNAMDIEITSSTLQIRAVGGVLDLYFFMGPSPMDVLNQMTSIVGRPMMPPYWSLGLMQSK